MKGNARNLLIMILLISLCGCGKSLSVRDRASIKNIYIAPQNVEYKDSSSLIYTAGTGSGVAALFGPLGTLVYEGALKDASPEDLIFKHYNDGNMLKNTVAEAFQYQFNRSKTFSSASKNKADAYLQIEIRSLEFFGSGEGNPVKHIGNYRGKLFDAKTDELLWEKIVYFTPMSKKVVKDYTLEQYLLNQDSLKDATGILSQKLAIEVIKSLRGMPSTVEYTLHKPDQPSTPHFKNSSQDVQSQITEKVRVKTNQQQIENELTENEIIEQKLVKLKSMYEKGIITKSEYDAKRAEIIEQY